MMSNQALNAARAARESGNSTTAVAPVKDPIKALMDKLTPEIKTALPAGMDVTRVVRVALTALRQNAALAKAAMENPLSFAGAMLRASALGIEVENGLGHAYLIPFKKRVKDASGKWVDGPLETQLIVGYRGMIDLARRSGQIESLYAVEVFGGESFEVELGLSNNIKHTRRFDVSSDPSNVVAVYAVAKLKGGEVQFDVMGRNQIELIRGRSKSKDSGPWVTDWSEMAKKTVLRRLFKWLPVSVEVKTSKDARSVSLETIANDDGGLTIDASTGEILTQGYQEPEQEPASSDLALAIARMEQATDIDGLNEAFVQGEGNVAEGDLAALKDAYRARKESLTGQGSLA